MKCYIWPSRLLLWFAVAIGIFLAVGRCFALIIARPRFREDETVRIT